MTTTSSRLLAVAAVTLVGMALLGDQFRLVAVALDLIDDARSAISIGRRERGAGGVVRGHRDWRGSSLEQLLRHTFVLSVRISPDPPNHRYDDADDEHDHQEQHDFPSPGDWRNRNNGCPESDHAQANNHIIAAIDARLFAQAPKRSPMLVGAAAAMVAA